SVVFDNCYAGNNISDGWDLQSVTYSSWIGCASEVNGGHGFRIRDAVLDLPTAGLSWISCGTESNQNAGWYLIAGDDSQYILGISIIGCFAYKNNLSGAWINCLYVQCTGAGATIDK